MPIQAILADIDGVLIDDGRLERIPDLWRDDVQQLRRQGFLFSLTSGRPYVQQARVFAQLVPDPHPLEGICYEGIGVKLAGEEQPHELGGFTPELRREIIALVGQYAHLFTGLVPSQNNEYSQGVLAFPTPGFVERGVTDRLVLEARYPAIKEVVETRLPGIKVGLSADAIDITCGLTKADALAEYSRLTTIPFRKMAVIGDAWNDWEMLELVSQAGGLAIYVGKVKKLEDQVRSLSNHLVPFHPGPQGTKQALGYLSLERHLGNI